MKGSVAERNARILVVDDDADELAAMVDVLSRITGLPVVPERRSPLAAERLRAETFDLLVTDMKMPKMDGLELLRVARSVDSEMAVIVCTGFPTVPEAVQSLKGGAVDYLVKPVDPDALAHTVRRLLEERHLMAENRLLSRHMGHPYAFDEIIGESEAMRDVFDVIDRVSGANVEVLIVGETGTGKELVAKSLHRRSNERAGRFVPVDCGAIPENLLESEFFGHERGAFSGATSRNIGLLELADQGTFFLDEIHTLPISLQAKLLRVLQERRVRRLGARDEISVDVRLVAAANRDPLELIAAGRFREDLYYRLNVARIVLPPLRERGEDIVLLARHFVERHAGEMGKDVKELSPDACESLRAYAWPGNVRQLQNVIRRALVMSSSDVIQVDDLPEEVVLGDERHAGSMRAPFFRLKTERVNAFEQQYISDLLRRFEGDVASAARDAGLPRGTLYRLMKKHGLRSDRFASGD